MAAENERQRVLDGLGELRRALVVRAGQRGGLAWHVALARVEGFELAAIAVFAQPALLMTTVDAIAREFERMRTDILG